MMGQDKFNKEYFSNIATTYSKGKSSKHYDINQILIDLLKLSASLGKRIDSFEVYEEIEKKYITLKQQGELDIKDVFILDDLNQLIKKNYPYLGSCSLEEKYKKELKELWNKHNNINLNFQKIWHKNTNHGVSPWIRNQIKEKNNEIRLSHLQYFLNDKELEALSQMNYTRYLNKNGVVIHKFGDIETVLPEYFDYICMYHSDEVVLPEYGKDVPLDFDTKKFSGTISLENLNYNQRFRIFLEKSGFDLNSGAEKISKFYSICLKIATQLGIKNENIFPGDSTGEDLSKILLGLYLLLGGEKFTMPCKFNGDEIICFGVETGGHVFFGEQYGKDLGEIRPFL